MAPSHGVAPPRACAGTRAGRRGGRVRRSRVGRGAARHGVGPRARGGRAVNGSAPARGPRRPARAGPRGRAPPGRRGAVDARDRRGARCLRGGGQGASPPRTRQAAGARGADGRARRREGGGEDGTDLLRGAVPPACRGRWQPVRLADPGGRGRHLRRCDRRAAERDRQRLVSEALAELGSASAAVEPAPPEGLLERLLVVADEPGVRGLVAVPARGAVSGARPALSVARLVAGAAAGTAVGWTTWRGIRAVRGRSHRSR